MYLRKQLVYHLKNLRTPENVIWKLQSCVQKLKFILKSTAQFSAPAREFREGKGEIHLEAVHISLLIHGLRK